MLQSPMNILTQFPVRKTKVQKKAFRDAVLDWVIRQGYAVTVEDGAFGARNVVIGDPEKASYLITAHYDTCAGMPLPNIVMPGNVVFYWLYQALLVLLMILICVAAGVLAGLILGEWAVSWVAMAVCFGFLLLILFGPANPNNANDNTSGVVTLLEILRTMPENQRKKVCYVLFDLEEAGLIGSSAYRKAHRQTTERQTVLNLDCVGDGDEIRMFPTKKLKKDRKKLTSLYKACGYFGKKSILVHEKGRYYYPSDQRRFPYGVGICALKKSKFGLYLGKIHTKKDTVLEITNVNLLRAALTTYISGDAG